MLLSYSTLSHLSVGWLFAFQSTVSMNRCQRECTEGNCRQQALITPIFCSMYVACVFSVRGCTCSMQAVWKLAFSNSQSCLGLEKTTFFALALHVGLACRLEPSVETQPGSAKRCGFAQCEWQANKGISHQHQWVHWHSSKNSARWALCQRQAYFCQGRVVFRSQGLEFTTEVCS